MRNPNARPILVARTAAGWQCRAWPSPIRSLAERKPGSRSARSSHREWTPAPDRSPAREVLAAQDESRVPELVPIRYGRMLASPFSFFRGAAAVMAADLGADARTPGSRRSSAATRTCPTSASSRRRTGASSSTSTTSTRRCPARSSGTSSASRRASRSRGASAGFAEAERRATIARRGARRTGRRCASSRACATWTSGTRASTSTSVRGTRRARASSKRRLKALREGTWPRRATRTACGRLDKLSERVDGEPRIVSDPPLIVPIEEMFPGERASIEPTLRALLARLPQDASLADRRLLARRATATSHAAHKVVGVGQRRDTRLDHPAARARRRRPAVPPGQGGAALGARAVRGQEPRSRTRAAGWSRASG